MGRQQQEALLKKTWLEREKQFYGDETETNFEIQEEEDEDIEDSGDEDELDRGNGGEEET
jgi:hypothetical protein